MCDTIISNYFIAFFKKDCPFGEFGKHCLTKYTYLFLIIKLQDLKKNLKVVGNSTEDSFF